MTRQELSVVIRLWGRGVRYAAIAETVDRSKSAVSKAVDRFRRAALERAGVEVRPETLDSLDVEALVASLARTPVAFAVQRRPAAAAADFWQVREADQAWLVMVREYHRGQGVPVV